MCALQGLVNTYAFKLVPWMETVAGVLHICLFIIFVVVLGVMGAHNDAKFVFLERNVSSGWSDTFVAWNLGMLTCVWSFTGLLTRKILEFSQLTSV